jgi:capsid protein
MIHAFLVNDDESQARGVPWAHAVTIDAKNLDEYDLGVITSAKMTAMSGGFFKKIIPEGETQFTGVETMRAMRSLPRSRCRRRRS